jgi:hypothetical protein
MWDLVHGIKTAAGNELQNLYRNHGVSVTATGDSRVAYYRHFDNSVEELGMTQRYNCWGFTFLPRRFWIGTPGDVDQILADNCTGVASGSLRQGDVVRYRDSTNTTTHTGRVWVVDGGGQCTKVRSKWGSMGEYIHDPLDVPSIYGTNLAYFRQHSPLTGIGDLFIHDSSFDTGEQGSPYLWASPDILVDAPPYGSADGNPIFGAVNRVSANVYNRSDAPITGVRVRYYWNDPHVGFSPGSWQMIPASPGHPNPTDPFDVPANDVVEAPYVDWTPQPVPGVADPAHQCLLAVSYVNDDPKDTYNSDPMVYPFEIAWENNLAARNVHILTMKAGSSKKLTVFMGLAEHLERAKQVDLHVELEHPPVLGGLGVPLRLHVPGVTIKAGAQAPLALFEAPRLVELRRLPRPALAPVRVAERHASPQPVRRDMHSVAGAMLPGHRLMALERIERITLRPAERVPVEVAIEAPCEVNEGSSFLIRLTQTDEGQITGSYTIAVRIVA